mgnify:CR=1 FL=1
MEIIIPFNGDTFKILVIPIIPPKNNVKIIRKTAPTLDSLVPDDFSACSAKPIIIAIGTIIVNAAFVADNLLIK